MTDPIPPNMMRAYADGELSPEVAADLDHRVADDAVARARFEAQVAAERGLRVRVAAVMTASDAPPADLAARVRTALAEASNEAPAPAYTAAHADAGSTAAAAPDDAVLIAPETAPPSGWRSWMNGPQRANALAVAATLALVAGAVLFGIFGKQIDQVRDRFTETALYASTEHSRCETIDRRVGKARWTDERSAPVRLHDHIGLAVPIADLSSLGYRFLGAGPCDLPGPFVSAHIIYIKDSSAPDGCPQTMVSLFVMPDTGQFGPTAPWDWRRAVDAPDATKTVATCSDGTLIYFLVTCDERDLSGLAQTLAREASRVP